MIFLGDDDGDDDGGENMTCGNILAGHDDGDGDDCDDDDNDDGKTIMVTHPHQQPFGQG